MVRCMNHRPDQVLRMRAGGGERAAGGQDCSATGRSVRKVTGQPVQFVRTPMAARRCTVISSRTAEAKAFSCNRPTSAAALEE